MTIDGVIRREEADGDGFKYGGWFFTVALRVTSSLVQERMAKPMDLLLGRRPSPHGKRIGRRIRAFWPNVMTAKKYVASNTRDSSD